jgi:branched-chain amino acid aminotransferase
MLSRCFRNPTAQARAFSFKASDLVIEKTTSPLPKPGPEHNYVFGDLSTDHMLICDYDSKDGWLAPKIQPFAPFQINPFNSTLHYALECFEGMKGYPNVDGKTVNLFRPMDNMRRLQNSFKYLAFPEFDADEYLKCIETLVDLDRDWMPKKDLKHSLYLRPTGISMENTLGVKAPNKVRLFTVISPVGPYYPAGFKPVSVYCEPHAVRAWHGGNGDKKLGSNYGPTIYPANQVIKKGYDQILWLVEDTVSEVGVMNFFVHWTNQEGKEELVTCPLDGTILPGVTRASVLDLTRDWGEFDVSEKHFTIQELAKALEEGRVKEAFGCGTAAVISPVKKLAYNGKDYEVPINSEAGAGPLASRLAETIVGIQNGKQKFRDWVVEI